MRVLLIGSMMAGSLFAAAPALAQSCGGTVHGLSRHYDPATGEGFLAVRAGPRTSASQLGELFNGDEVTILRRRGNWYRIDAEDIGLGWVYTKYVNADC